jgi:hypothetical protein
VKSKFPISILILFILASCSVDKRIYRKGYHIGWLHHKKEIRLHENKTEVAKTISKSEEPVAIEVAFSVNQNNEEPVSASAQKRIVLPSNNRSKLVDDECGDFINFKKGDVVKAKVLEITPTEIKYRRCDNLNGPLIVVAKNDIYSIKYVNGHEEHFFREVPQSSSSGSDANTINIEKNPHPMAIVVAALAYGCLLLWFIPAIIGLFLVPVAKRAVLRAGNKYAVEDSLDLIRGATIAFWVVIALTLLLLLLFLVMMAAFGI